ncbi:hypothetical protein B0H63DRAFT_447479 [Podospora didyma]|uniref:RNA-directed RNA polymerase n=1 Tax=Podospora didyma TaxID=330526 RepID=A0AAE0NRV3_9PEZI|nr:hypothetical protein B0H63DRAFT_447479 [Podospora didyma]
MCDGAYCQEHNDLTEKLQDMPMTMKTQSNGLGLPGRMPVTLECRECDFFPRGPDAKKEMAKHLQTKNHRPTEEYWRNSQFRYHREHEHPTAKDDLVRVPGNDEVDEVRRRTSKTRQGNGGDATGTVAFPAFQIHSPGSNFGNESGIEPYILELNSGEWLQPPVTEHQAGPPETKPADVPLADSGYGSAAAPVLSSWRQDADAEIEQYQPDEEKTVCSDATTILPQFVQECIQATCEDIRMKVGRQLNGNDWTVISGDVPDLLKEFAVMIASGDSSDTNRRIMHFVYRRHQEIASQLAGLFEHDDEAITPDSAVQKPGSMSLGDRIAWWDMIPGLSPPETSDPPPDYYSAEDSESEDGGDLHHPELSRYIKIILSSPAYEWLLESLVKKARVGANAEEPG